ncbi:HvfC family RiPP maturation protein [Wenzhouxiangella sp. EGI_FJ10305]|uniref:HvfC family RiPP maturation protein n=1 Tax=Wenzhouxiangella sp. EGI_FJ10305 TaxID=3243768 RepID=UPI0035E25288
MPPHNNSNSPPESLLALQRQFAGHIRDPEHIQAPDGPEDRRLAIYRRLFFGNLSNLFSKNFPVLHRIVERERWQSLIREFLVEHRSTTPMFTEIGREFVRFLEEDKPDGLPPFALELAHWEFLETCVRLAEADPTRVSCDPEGDLLPAPIELNPTLRLAQYQWPVHEISPDNQPRQPLEQPLILAAWRRRNDRTGFMKLNAVTARLLEIIDQEPELSGQAALEKIAGEMRAPDPQAIVQSGRSMLDRLREREVILGSRSSASQ